MGNNELTIRQIEALGVNSDIRRLLLDIAGQCSVKTLDAGLSVVNLQSGHDNPTILANIARIQKSVGQATKVEVGPGTTISPVGMLNSREDDVVLSIDQAFDFSIPNQWLPFYNRKKGVVISTIGNIGEFKGIHANKMRMIAPYPDSIREVVIETLGSLGDKGELRVLCDPMYYRTKYNEAVAMAWPEKMVPSTEEWKDLMSQHGVRVRLLEQNIHTLIKKPDITFGPVISGYLPNPKEEYVDTYMIPVFAFTK